MTVAPKRHIAYFVTPHGYGHAARAVAVMEVLLRQRPDVHFDVFTLVPAWFFNSCPPDSYDYHSVLTDVGLAQCTALSEDIPATVERLAQVMPFDEDWVSGLAGRLREIDCRLVMCDIAPLGIAVARAAGIPSVLVENFTWDHIYAGYVEEDRRLRWYIDYLADLFAGADYRIQAEPACQHHTGSLTTAPISRASRTSSEVVREQLGVPRRAPMVLVTMGGFSWDYGFLDALAARRDIFFVVPGGRDRLSGVVDRSPNVICLPHHSRFFHPDLVNSSDVVIGKLGYSTVAEVYWSGCALGYVPRPRFRESDVLVEFVAREMSGLPVSAAEFDAAAWLDKLDDLLAMPRRVHEGPNGAEQAAEFVAGLLTG
jgi:hypothetical protein